MTEKTHNSDLTIVCPECMTTGFTVSLSAVCVHLVCNECNELFSLSIIDLSRDVFDSANDVGLLVSTAVSS